MDLRGGRHRRSRHGAASVLLGASEGSARDREGGTEAHRRRAGRGDREDLRILVYGSETLTAPITGRQCAAYSVVVRERDRDARNTATIDEADARSFRVEDESGVAWVQPTLVDLVVSMDRNLQTGFFEDPTPRMTAFLDAHGLEARGFLFNRVLEFSEGILEGGEAVAVLGVGAWEPDPDPTSSGRGGYRERAVRLRVTDPPDANMILSDDPATLG